MFDALAADLVLTGARVLTVDRDFSLAEAVAVKGDRIVAVGTSSDIQALAGRHTRVLELGGRTVLPGINDAHLHLSWFGLAQAPTTLDLSSGSVKSLAELRALVAQRAAELPRGQWLRGQGWHEQSLPELKRDSRGPSRADLDDVSPDRPVVLDHFSHHAVWVNSLALAAAGITRDTPDPAGGIIVRDSSTGEPTGHLLETAAALVRQKIPPPTLAERSAATIAGMKELNSLGITSVTDPIVGPEQLRNYIALLNDGEFPLRVNALLNWSWPSMQSTVSQLKEVLAAGGFASGLGNEWLRVGGCKLFADGVPSLQTAWMHEPYGDGGCGSLVTRGETDDERTAELFGMIELLHRHRLQVQVHATGERAIDTVVDGFVRAARADRWPEARHAVIHSNFVSANTAALMAHYGFGAITNSLIKWQTAETSRSLMGEVRWHHNMPWRSLLGAGVHLADSSDAPITYPDWRQAIEMLVLREVRGSGVVSGPEERLTREQAIRAWTIEPAYLEHAEHVKGSIEPGKLADLVIVDEDLLRVDAHELHGLRPVLTLLGGRVVHAASPPLGDL